MKTITINTLIGTKVKEIGAEQYRETKILKVFEDKKQLWITVNIFGKWTMDVLAEDFEIVEEIEMKEEIRCPDFSNAKVGDVVYSPNFGKGKITRLNVIGFHPLFVEFEHLGMEYTSQGKLPNYDIYPSLFWQPIPIPTEAYVRPLPKLEVDTLVWVWDKDKTKKRLSFFERFEDGKIVCFPNGTNSAYPNNSASKYWSNWELYEPNTTTVNGGSINAPYMKR